MKNESINDKMNRFHQELYDRSEKLVSETDSIFNEMSKQKEQIKFLVKDR